MDEKGIPDLLSHLIPDAAESAPEQDNLLVQSLRALAGQSGESAAVEVDAFLSGKGTLHETTRAALLSGKSSAVEDLTQVLINQFKLSPTIASVIAGLLVQVMPSIGKSTTKKKPRKKAKPKTTASTKKKPKKKATSKPKPSTAKPAAKKKPSAKTGKKKPAAKKKPKSTKRTLTLDES